MKTCPHCQKELTEPNEVLEEQIENAEVLNQSEEEPDRIIEEATKKVVGQVLEVIQPLLEKLGEAHPGVKPDGPLGSELGSSQQYQVQLEQIQQAAKERLSRQEEHLKAKLQQLQSRFSRR